MFVKDTIVFVDAGGMYGWKWKLIGWFVKVLMEYC